MSQVATKKKLSIGDARVKVTGHFHEQGSVLAGTHAGACDGFQIEVAIEAGETSETISDLVKMARQMCFTEDALTREMRLTTTLRLNGESIE